ncbi:MAG: hypothetical protein DRQ78_06370 [Epsilonproteobacteria bacterium]|nr:MAG: hypothetical protein DRQ78_06370 [Campylobacterota bacterium]
MSQEKATSTEEDKIDKSLRIKANKDGSMGLDFDGDFNLYEIIGMLTVTLCDLSVKNFIVPQMNEQSTKIVEHILSNNINNAAPDLTQGMEDINQLNDSVKKIMGLVDAFKGVQGAGPATAP